MSSHAPARGWPALWRLIGRYLRPHLGKVLLLFTLMLIDVGAQLALPLLLARFVDGVIGGAVLGALLPIAAVYLIAAVGRQIMRSVRAYLATDVGMRATNTLRADLLRHTLGLDTAWHNSTTPGVLIERIDGDANMVNKLLSSLGPDVLGNLLLLAGGVIAFFWIDWRAGLLVMTLVGVIFLLLRLVGGPVERAYEHERAQAAALTGLVEERLAGIEDVRANGAVEHVMRRFFKESRVWSSIYRRSQLLGSLTWATPSLINGLISVSELALGVWLFSRGELTVGGVLALYRYTETISQPWMQLGRQLSELLQAAAAAARLADLAALKPLVTDTGSAALPAGPLPLQLRNLTFTYADGEEPVLENVSFELRAGRVLGVLGRTGSGKTTLARLIARLYDYRVKDGGSIQLAGLALPEIAMRNLRQRVTMITQDVQLFSATVRDNVTLYDSTIGDERVWQALDSVGLSGWARTLPNGLDTQLASGSSGLSAGQAQLLAFARAFMRAPGLVLMDEASSRLDPATEQQLESAVDHLLQGRTAIIIAHRLNTLDRADDILVLEDGRIAEFGARETLAQDSGSRYYALRNLGAEEMLA
jgi:ATP-binding cassette, subfamily B, bacterial